MNDTGHNPHDPSSARSDRTRDTGRGYLTASAYEKKARSIHREGRHSALCVLSDRELLMIQALAAHEVCTIHTYTYSPPFLSRSCEYTPR